MKILFWDIETSPNVADVWGLWDQNVGLGQLHESTRVLCFAAKWAGKKEKTKFFSEWTHGREDMLEQAWQLLNEADVVVSYNGDRFDTQHLNREFVQAGMSPPSPFKSVDVLKSVKQRFRFPSNKLAYVSKVLGLEGKLQHEGHALWTKVLAGDAKAQKVMERYNVQDVVLLEKVHDKLLPWLVNYPNVNLYKGDGAGCPKCGSVHIQRRGTVATAARTYQRLFCTDCGSWSRNNVTEDKTKITGIR